jgi:hypothetical protein
MRRRFDRRRVDVDSFNTADSRRGSHAPLTRRRAGWMLF